ncbi:MAG: hypothetical protein A2V76_07985 [Candidatus Aminicenantes bacterium RBG_16_63_14]|nr:MAG: hypothetical protein A2V76_07985 [Candidatus Aminicenantes bacterium RBG_16_63_14]OGD29457.1 MAG: hypothetical protein A2V57_07520 [Candidatus Aminicenantes bacterium RBG_19FT_COMBO_65_30]
MKKLTVLAAGLLLLVPCLVFSDSFSLRLGYFMPRASTDIILHPDSLWAIEFDQMSFRMQDFRGTTLGAGYEYFLGKNLSLAFTLDAFSKSRLGDYLYYDQTEFDEGWFAFPTDLEPSDIVDWYYISHSFKVSSTPLQLSLKFMPLGRKTRLIPFVGGGAGLYLWSVRMYGEMVNFADPWLYTDPELGDIDILPVESVNGREKGSVFGYHAFAGLQFPIGYRATIDAEARYHWAKARFDTWFQGFEDFDLGGLALTVGFSYWF